MKIKKRMKQLGKVDAIKSRAIGQKTARIEQALGDVSLFNNLHAEYAKNKEITRQRLVIETLEQVLPKAKIYIMNDTGETVKYLTASTIGKPTPPPADRKQKEAMATDDE